MGTGKTTVGKILAERLRLRFVDMDDFIEAKEGKKISAIFAEFGEHYFRQVESNVARELAGQQGLVIATGGGVVLNSNNTDVLSATGFAVCLWAEPEIVIERVKHDASRPLLAVPDRLGKITELLEKRNPLYFALPHILDTGPLSPADVAKKIIELYDNNTNKRS